MEIKTLYFASARELASTPAETLTVPDGSTLLWLVGTIIELHPALRKMRSSLKFSVNHEVVDSDAPLKEGDEVGVLPPVAGG